MQSYIMVCMCAKACKKLIGVLHREGIPQKRNIVFPQSAMHRRARRNGAGPFLLAAIEPSSDSGTAAWPAFLTQVGGYCAAMSACDGRRHRLRARSPAAGAVLAGPPSVCANALGPRRSPAPARADRSPCAHRHRRREWARPSPKRRVLISSSRRCHFILSGVVLAALVAPPSARRLRRRGVRQVANHSPALPDGHPGSSSSAWG